MPLFVFFSPPLIHIIQYVTHEPYKNHFLFPPHLKGNSSLHPFLCTIKKSLHLVGWLCDLFWDFIWILLKWCNFRADQFKNNHVNCWGSGRYAFFCFYWINLSIVSSLRNFSANSLILQWSPQRVVGQVLLIFLNGFPLCCHWGLNWRPTKQETPDPKY